jgi:hypothetical protein
VLVPNLSGALRTYLERLYAGHGSELGVPLVGEPSTGHSYSSWPPRSLPLLCFWFVAGRSAANCKTWVETNGLLRARRFTA